MLTTRASTCPACPCVLLGTDQSLRRHVHVQCRPQVLRVALLVRVFDCFSVCWKDCVFPHVCTRCRARPLIHAVCGCFSFVFYIWCYSLLFLHSPNLCVSVWRQQPSRQRTWDPEWPAFHPLQLVSPLAQTFQRLHFTRFSMVCYDDMFVTRLGYYVASVDKAAQICDLPASFLNFHHNIQFPGVAAQRSAAWRDGVFRLSAPPQHLGVSRTQQYAFALCARGRCGRALG